MLKVKNRYDRLGTLVRALAFVSTGAQAEDVKTRIGRADLSERNSFQGVHDRTTG
jgi:hypothetical protein